MSFSSIRDLRKAHILRTPATITMKFSATILTLVLAALSYGAQAAPSPASTLEELTARGCSCHKLGDEWICGGTTCP